MADVTNTQVNPNQAAGAGDEQDFEDTIAGAMESFVPTLVFPLIQKVTDDMKENME